METHDLHHHPSIKLMRKQHQVFFVLLFLVAIGLFVLGWSLWAFFIMMVGGIALWLWSDVTLTKRKNRLLQQRKIDMMEAMAYVKIFLFSGMNVYQALKQTQVYASSWMRTRLQMTLSKIDDDKSFRPYFELARPLNTLAMEQLMIALYQITQTGLTSVYLSHFFYVFDQLEASMSRLTFTHYEEELEGLHTWAMIGTSVITLTILYSIIHLIQGFIHGL